MSANHIFNLFEIKHLKERFFCEIEIIICLPSLQIQLMKQKNQASIYYHATKVHQAECRSCQIVHSDGVQDTQDRTMLPAGFYL